MVRVIEATETMLVAGASNEDEGEWFSRRVVLSVAREVLIGAREGDVEARVVTRDGRARIWRARGFPGTCAGFLA